MVYSSSPPIIQNAIEFCLKLYNALYQLYDNVISVINEPLRDALPDIGVVDDILITLLDYLNWWGGADVSIFELAVGALLPNVIVVSVAYWLLKWIDRIFPL